MKEVIKRVWSFLSQPKVYWRLFSLLLAVIFWLLAAGDGNFTSRESFFRCGDHNLPADQIIVDPPGAVTLRLSGLSPFTRSGGLPPLWT